MSAYLYNFKKGNLKFSFFLLFLFFLPIFILGKSSYILIDDGINADFIIYHILKEKGLLFNYNPSNIIENIFGGTLNLSFIGTRIPAISFLFLLFDSFSAYTINSIIVRLIGFFGFKRLLNNHLNNLNNSYVVLISLAYSLVPINTLSGITILGLPLLLDSFLNLEKEKRIFMSFFQIFLYSFYSGVLLTPFLIVIIFIWLIFKIYSRSSYSKILIGLSIFCILFFVLNFHLIINISADESHRTLRLLYASNQPSFLGVIYGLIKKTLIGFYHPTWLVSIPIIICMIRYFKFLDKQIFYLFLLIIFFNLIDLTRPILENYFSYFKVFDIGRINWINPFLFFLLFAMIISKVNKKSRKPFLYIIIFSQIFLNFIRNPEFIFNIFDNKKAGEIFFNDDILIKNLSQFRSMPNNINKISSLNFKDFLSEDLFNEIKMYINKKQDSYKVIGYGLDPSILIYNGFNTLDGYYPNHSKEYHLEFNKIQNNYDVKASNFLLLNYPNCHNCSLDIGDFETKTLDLNLNQIKKMDGKYIISAVNIKSLDPNLVYIEKFKNENYNIYLYEVQ